MWDRRKVPVKIGIDMDVFIGSRSIGMKEYVESNDMKVLERRAISLVRRKIKQALKIIR